MARSMSEPVSSSVAGIAGWKLLGGLATVLTIAAALAAIVVMCMTHPRSKREWAVGIISTVVGAIAGGAAVIQHFSLQAWTQDYIGLVAVLGVAFICGLPAWTLVRSIFTYLEKQKDKDIVEIAKDVKDLKS
jgi:hypothetical protein